MSRLVVILLFSMCITSGYAQVGIDTTNPDPSSILDVTSSGNNKGFLIPRLTSTQRDNIVTPATGLLVYNTTTSSFSYFNGTIWVDILGGEKNIYTNNGTLTGTRIVNQNNNNLTFQTGTGRTIIDGNLDTRGAVYGKVRTVSAIPIVWQDDDYAIIIQVASSNFINLPNPTLYAGRMLLIRNNSIEAGSGGTYTYATPYQPINNTTILNGRSQTLISNGVNWYVISGL